MMTDPIADMLTRMRNALMSGATNCVVPGSRLKVAILDTLKREGFIDRYEVTSEGSHAQLTIVLRYGARRAPALQGVKRISKPGHRVYRGASELPRVQGGLGVAVVSTSQGMLPDREARRRRLGGEIVCEVW